MNTHENIEELADLATAGAWEPDAHATSCGSCTAAIADARAFQRWTSGLLGPDAPPADLEERLIKAFRATDTAAARRFRLLPGKRVLTWAAAAAALVGIVALGGAFSPSDDRAKTLASVEYDGRLHDQAGKDTVDNFSDFKEWNGYLGLGESRRGPVQVPFTLDHDASLHLGGKVSEIDSERPGRVDVVSDGLALDVVSRTAGGSGPLTGTTFSLDAGLVQESSGENSAKSWAFVSRQAKNADAYQRDVESLKEYNTALQRDHAALGLRGKGDKAGRGEVMERLKAQSGAQAGEALLRLGEEPTDAARQAAQTLEEMRKLEMTRRVVESESSLPAPAKTVSPTFSLNEPQISTLAAAYDEAQPRGAKPAVKGTATPIEAPAVFYTETKVMVPGSTITDPKFRLVDFPGVDISLAQDPRKLIRTARLALEVEGYDATQAKVATAAAEEKGYVASADTERLQNGKIRATVTLRVPPDRFEALLAKLRVLGTVKHQTLATEDVGKSYFDMEARMGAKQALLDRLKKVLAEAKGSVKELMDVEIQMGATLEQIEALKGELKYLDSQVSLATITLELAEKDLGQPFEYVQTLQSRIGLVTSDVDAAYAAAQKAVVDAGGQVVDSKMTRQNDGAATGTVRARVEAGKFPDVRQALRALGHVETDTVDQQKSARGGAPTAFAPVRVEQATIDLSVTTPALLVSRKALIVVETKGVEAAYQAARKAVEAAGGRVLDGGLSNSTAGGAASLTLQVDVAKFADLVELFRAAGEVKHAVVNQSAGVLAVPLRERGEIVLQLKSPPALIGEEQGLGRIVRDTFSRSWAGLLWSVEKLFVGLSLAGPWALALVAIWLLWRKRRRQGAVTK